MGEIAFSLFSHFKERQAEFVMNDFFSYSVYMAVAKISRLARITRTEISNDNSLTKLLFQMYTSQKYKKLFDASKSDMLTDSVNLKCQ